MARVIIPVLSIALTIYALSDLVQAEDAKVRGIPKWAWIVLVVLLPWVGPITWLVVSRSRPPGTRSTPPRTRPLAPDEDPEFLRSLDEQIRRERRDRERAREARTGQDQPDPQDQQDAAEGPQEEDRPDEQDRSGTDPGRNGGSPDA